MPRPKSLVATKRLEVKVPLVIYEAMLRHQQHREALGIPTTLQGTMVAALGNMMIKAGYLNQNSGELG